MVGELQWKRPFRKSGYALKDVIKADVGQSFFKIFY
jgi:hypothetical protein